MSSDNTCDEVHEGSGKLFVCVPKGSATHRPRSFYGATADAAYKSYLLDQESATSRAFEGKRHDTPFELKWFIATPVQASDLIPTWNAQADDVKLQT